MADNTVALPMNSKKGYVSETFFKNLTWLNTNEAAEYFRVTPGNIRVLIYRGVLSPYKLNNRNRFRREELDRLIESSLKKGMKK